MASSMPQLDAPPPQPPDVSSQMGAGAPFAGVSSMLQQKGDQGGGGANPKGALQAQAEACKKVVDQMAKMEPGFGPFADRIKSLLDAGIGVISSAGPQPGSSGDQGAPGMAGAPPGGGSNAPGPMGAQAPGSGFPG
jgi:hypothetical protein